MAPHPRPRPSQSHHGPGPMAATRAAARRCAGSALCAGVCGVIACMCDCWGGTQHRDERGWRGRTMPSSATEAHSGVVCQRLPKCAGLSLAATRPAGAVRELANVSTQQPHVHHPTGRQGLKSGRASHLQATKPPRPTGMMGASLPPAIITSASPLRMWLAAAQAPRGVGCGT